MGTFIRTCLGLLSLWLGIGSPALSATIAKTAAIVAITGENTTTTYGNVTALHALVTGSNPGGLVTFKEGSKVLGTGNLDENNTAHLVKRLDIGTHSITAAYSGDAYNTANTSPVATVTINKALSAFNWSFGSYYPAVGVALPITIAIVGFDATPPTGTLSLAICKASCALPGADIPVGTATLVNGSAAFSYTPTVAGDVYFIATYSGDARNLANSGAYPQRFPAKATPSVAAYPDTKTLGRNEPVNVLTKVFGANATGGVQLTETVNGVKTTLATCALVSGSCTSKISFSTAGTHVVVPTYLGNTFNNTASDGPISFSVTAKHIPKLSLAIIPNPAIAGQSVQVIASLQGYYPSGYIPFPYSWTVRNAAGTTVFTGYSGSNWPTSQKGYQTRVATTAGTTAGPQTWTFSYGGDLYNDTATTTFTQEVVAAGSPSPGLETWNYDHDAENQLTQITNPVGDLTTRNYDGLGRLASIVQPDPIAGGASTGPTITVSQNAQGQTTGIHDGRVQTSYDIDGLGRAKSETSPDITRIDRVFDDLGRPLLIQPTAPALPSVYSFDEISRLARIDYTGGIATEFSYDGNGLNPEAQGQLTHLIDESGITDYTYSAFGEVISKTQAATIAGLSKSHIVRYGWGNDPGNAGHLTTLTYPSGSQVEYVYGTDGRVSQVLVHPVSVNGAGPNLATSTAFMSAVQWTAWGALKRWTTQSGRPAIRTYDTYGRLTVVPFGLSSTRTPVGGAMTYDSLGHLISQRRDVTRSYAYDALGRFTGLTDSTTPTSAPRYLGYAYDTSNNRTLSQVNNLTLNTTVIPNTNLLYSVEQWSSAVSASGAPLPSVYDQIHDNAGRLIDDGTNQYRYSDRGRLASVRNTAGVTSFLYNGLEQRVAKSGPLGTFFYVYDEAGHVLGEYDAAGAPRYEVIWLGDIPVGVIRTSYDAATATYTAVTDEIYVDHLNTPRTIYSAAGTLLWSWLTNEDPYGQTSQPLIYQAGYAFNLRMPGQIFDKETGLFHNGHRDYNPATGRYIQPDPIGLNGGINRYAYVGGNPVSYTDSTGLIVPALAIPFIGSITALDLGATVAFIGSGVALIADKLDSLIFSRGGERGYAGNAGGTANPAKHWKDDPKNPGWGWEKNPQTGKKTYKRKPPYINDEEEKSCP